VPWAIIASAWAIKKKFYPETTSINVMQRGADAIC
jgi:hypothetical protein